MPSITFNGKTYNDLAEMPAAERQAYEQVMSHFKDENQDGIPDIFQGDVVSNIVNAVASTNIVVDGQQIGGFQNLTQEQRLKLERGLATLQKMGILHEMPNLDGEQGVPPAFGQDTVAENLPGWLDSEIRASAPLIPQNSAIQEDSGNARNLVILLAVISLFVCGAGAFFYFMMGT